ncbi:p23 [Phellodendron-associated higre-like virus]|uniref:P23 n=1 Tax=Phellodendron-associated higre-like virus TaxID=3022218 RepID=A0AAT9T5B6_9VIRU
MSAVSGVAEDVGVYSVSLEGLPRAFFDDIVNRYQSFVVESVSVDSFEPDFHEPSMLQLDPINPCTSFKALCVCSGVLPDFRSLIQVHICDHYTSSAKRVKSVIVNVLPSCSDFDSIVRLTYPDVEGAFSFHSCRAKAIAAKWSSIVAYFSNIKQERARENARRVRAGKAQEPAATQKSESSEELGEAPYPSRVLRGRGRGRQTRGVPH